MKTKSTIFGILLVIIGALMLAYQTITYPKEENLVQMGDVRLTAKEDKTLHIPPYVGGVVIACGVLLVLVGRRK